MSIMIKVSYESSQELAFLLELLHPFIKSCKVAKKQEGQYKRAYIKLNK